MVCVLYIVSYLSSGSDRHHCERIIKSKADKIPGILRKSVSEKICAFQMSGEIDWTVRVTLTSFHLEIHLK